MPEPRTCRVSYIDREGSEHAVQVVARSRNEAAIRALARFRQSEFADFIRPTLYDKLIVRTVIEESYEVTVAEAEAWLKRQGTPREMALKHELQQLFPPREDTRRRKRPER